MADNRIRLPSSQGGLIRYDDEIKSKLMVSPVVILVIIGLVALGVLILGVFLA